MSSEMGIFMTRNKTKPVRPVSVHVLAANSVQEDVDTCRSTHACFKELSILKHLKCIASDSLFEVGGVRL